MTEYNHALFVAGEDDGADYRILNYCGSFGGGTAEEAAAAIQNTGGFDAGDYYVVSWPDTMKLQDVVEEKSRDVHVIRESAYGNIDFEVTEVTLGEP